MWKRILETCLIILLVFAFLQYSPIMIVHLTGESMKYTLRDSQYALVVRRPYTHISRGDIVAAKVDVQQSWLADVPQTNATITIQVVKRVIGLPGEQVKVDNGVVYINGKPLEEPYVLLHDNTSAPTVVLGPDQYYVLGDNRVESLDSRIFGPIRIDQIDGKVVIY